MGPAETITQFHAAVAAKDIEAIKHAYVESEELYVILEGPRLSNRGHSNISKGWTDFCNSGLSLESITWTEGPYEDIEGNMSWVGGVIVLSVAVGERTFTQTFRSTFVLLKEEDQWKIKHEHVSAALEDPYGIGDWLKESS
ncbi:MAG: nuclear transport factor 2 family protein [Bacteroidota bacterium]